ncbi:hypothetical protein T484DRAFT_1756605 [Baffinella frigidus]|nr:hypothetical protein T484DRAFT_1756605 [Cryptophyta sp. CCMP2293]
MDGVKTVILGFDDSTNSPYAKAATQAKRRSRSELMEWHELMPLPQNIPANYGTLLFNRNFKTRVIKYIIEQVTLNSNVNADQRIIIDYMQAPYVAVGIGSGLQGTHVGNGGIPESALEFEIACPLGECDVKWVRYVGMGDLILDAVDSDYVIIALATIERLKRAAPRIFVKRLLLEPGNAALAVAGDDGEGAKKTGVKKRKGGMFTVPDSNANKENVNPNNNAPVVKKPRVYEYADAGVIVDALRGTLSKRTPDALKPHMMRILAHLVALCGCDFTRGVKWFNATSAFKNAGLLWPGLCAAATVDNETGVVVMDPRLIAERVIGVLWKEVQFKKLCDNPAMKHADFETLFKELSTNTTISAFRRDRLISPMELCCLVRSSNWCCFYWSDPEHTPCSLTGGEYGFTRTRAGGAVQFDDKRPLPSKIERKALDAMPHTWLTPS